MSTSVLRSAALSASYNIFLQVIFRIGTFILNGVILHYISRDLLGVVNVRLTLLYTTILFVAEAFRRACFSKMSEARNWTQLMNLMWFIPPLGVFASTVLCYVWVQYLEQPDPSAVPFYSLGVIVFGVSAVIELFAQPLCISAQILLFVRLKVVLEGSALAVRCILTVLCVVYRPDLGLLGFCFAQVVYSCILCFGYYGYFFHIIYTSRHSELPFKSWTQIFPQPHKPWVGSELAHLTISFLKQSFLKQILTEGERYVMTVLDVLTFAEQGVYDVINNLGSLVARFIFLPLEDSAYLLFTQLLTRGQPANKQSNMLEAVTVLKALLRLVSLIGSIILTFGQTYSHLLLHLYGGTLLTQGTGPLLLQSYCVYVLLLALNGITECFAFATMTKAEVDRYNYKMLIFSILFLVSSWYLSLLIGSVGLVLANSLNMIFRIAHSIFHMTLYFSSTEHKPLHWLLLSKPVYAALAVAWLVTYSSEKYFYGAPGAFFKLVHLSVGVLTGLTVLAVIYVYEKDLLQFIYQLYKKKKD